MFVEIIFIEYVVPHKLFKSFFVIFVRAKATFILDAYSRVVLDKSRTNISFQILVVGQIVKGFGEKNNARDSLLPVNDNVFLRSSDNRFELINESADEMRFSVFDDMNRVIEELLAVDCFPIVIALINGNDKCYLTRNKFCELLKACMHKKSSPEKFFVIIKLKSNSCKKILTICGAVYFSIAACYNSLQNLFPNVGRRTLKAYGKKI